MLHGVFWAEKNPVLPGFFCERYWDRTSDLFRVREARYRCANRSYQFLRTGGGCGIRTRVDGFAGRCLASRPIHHEWFPTHSELAV
jgi:hypothetical protein